MRRITLALAALLLAAPAFAQDDDQDHTPPSKILSMSVDQWNADFAKRHGGEETEASDRQSLALYADALRGRNDAALRRLPPPARARIAEARRIVRSMSDNALSVSQVYNGGGTMYIEIFAGAAVETEQFAWTLIQQTRRPGRPQSASDRRLIASRLSRFQTAIRPYDPSSPAGRKRLEETYGSDLTNDRRKAVRESYAGLKSDLRALRVWSAKASSREALAVTGFLTRHLPNWLDTLEEKH